MGRSREEARKKPANAKSGGDDSYFIKIGTLQESHSKKQTQTSKETPRKPPTPLELAQSQRERLLNESNAGEGEIASFLTVVKNKGENKGKIDYQKLITALDNEADFNRIINNLDGTPDGKIKLNGTPDVEFKRRKPIDRDKFKKALLLDHFAKELKQLYREEEADKKKDKPESPYYWAEQRERLAVRYSERPELSRHTGFFKGLGVLFKNIFKGKLDTRTNSQVHLDSFIQTQRDIKARLQQATQGKSSKKVDEDKSATPPMKSPYSP